LRGGPRYRHGTRKEETLRRKKKLTKKIKLNRETLRQLAEEPLESVAAAATITCGVSCQTVCSRCPSYCCV